MSSSSYESGIAKLSKWSLSLQTCLSATWWSGDKCCVISSLSSSYLGNQGTIHSNPSCWYQSPSVCNLQYYTHTLCWLHAIKATGTGNYTDPKLASFSLFSVWNTNFWRFLHLLFSAGVDIFAIIILSNARWELGGVVTRRGTSWEFIHCKSDRRRNAYLLAGSPSLPHLHNHCMASAST